MAQTMAAAGQTPYLQFGEVQWWYFPGEELTVPAIAAKYAALRCVHETASILPEYGSANLPVDRNEHRRSGELYLLAAALLP